MGSAACAALEPGQARRLLHAAGEFEPRHRDALIHGLLDAADTIDANRRRRLIRRGLQTAQASVRRTALDRLCHVEARSIVLEAVTRRIVAERSDRTMTAPAAVRR